MGFKIRGFWYGEGICGNWVKFVLMPFKRGLLESNSMKDAAVDVVEAMAVAPTGRGWL